MSNPQDKQNDHDLSTAANHQSSLIRLLYQEIQQRFAEMDKDIMNFLLQKTNVSLAHFVSEPTTLTEDDFNIGELKEAVNHLAEILKIYAILIHQLECYNEKISKKVKRTKLKGKKSNNSTMSKLCFQKNFFPFIS